MVMTSKSQKCHRFLLKFYDETHRKYDRHNELYKENTVIQKHMFDLYDVHVSIVCSCSLSTNFFLLFYKIPIDRTTLNEQEEESLQQSVYKYLKGQNSGQTQIKCNVGDGGIGDLVEEITISRPILVRFCCCCLAHTLAEWVILVSPLPFAFVFSFHSPSVIQLNDAEFEDIDFFVYSVNDQGAEMETINVSILDING